MKLYLLLLGAAALLALTPGCKKDVLSSNSPGTTPRAALADPPTTWQEHWFEHNQLLQRKYFDTSVAVYYDNDVNTSITWPFSYLGQAWNYTKHTYGSFGTDTRLFAIFHAGKYSGGHPSTYMDASHDYRNVIDVGSSDPNAWLSGTGNDIDLTTHEIGHIVEGASKGVHNSPAFGIWHDSKWMEIYQYDVYVGLGRSADVTRWYNLEMANSDNFPRANTHWFKDWFYPIYSWYSQAATLNKFFTLLAQYFPKHSFNNGIATYPEYDRGMNMGEFVHFWSGAAGVDLKPLALSAFGNLDEGGSDWTTQLTTAQSTFPGVTYAKDITAAGTFSANKENSSGATSAEGSTKMTDANYNTKFLIFNYAPDFYIQLLYGTAQVAHSYALTSGNDAPDRDPKSWNLQGSNNGTTWTTLDTRTNETFSARIFTKRYTFSNSTAYKYYRLNITANNGSSIWQLSEWRLLQ